MKLRIKGNHIRLRLTQSEVNRLAEGESVSESTVLSILDSFGYRIRPWNLEVVECSFDENLLTVSVPASQVVTWANSDQVGIEASQENGLDEKLHILVEKDFTCLKARTGEDESDHFPNPLQSSEKC